MTDPISVRIVVRTTDGDKEVRSEIRPFGKSVTMDDIVRAGEEAVRKLELRTPRKNPQPVDVTVFTQRLEKGDIKEHPYHTQVVPYLERMTDTEYTEEMEELLRPLPPEFHSFVREQAYEQGHSSGYEEVVSIASEMAHNLKPCVTAHYFAILDRVAQPGNQEIVNRLASKG